MQAVVKQKNRGWADKLLKRAKALGEVEAACGFPKSLNIKYDNGASLIDVAIWNQYGTYNAPARDFMNPANAEIQKQWKDMAKAAMPAINAGQADPKTVLELGANMAKAEIQKSIVNLQDPPNSPVTVQGGWIRNKKSGKLVYVEGKGSDNPLIDTGKMLTSVTYTIRKRG